MSRHPKSLRRKIAPPSATAEEKMALLGKRIQAMRVALGLERKDLAHRVGIRSDRLKRIEEGQGRLEASLIHALALAFNVTVAEILEESSNFSPAVLDPEGRELMRFFGAIRDAAIRRSILKLAKALSEKP